MAQLPNRQVLNEGPVLEEDAWQILRGILAGLAHIHSQGVIHRCGREVCVFVGGSVGVCGRRRNSFGDGCGVQRKSRAGQVFEVACAGPRLITALSHSPHTMLTPCLRVPLLLPWLCPALHTSEI